MDKVVERKVRLACREATGIDDERKPVVFMAKLIQEGYDIVPLEIADWIRAFPKGA